MPAKGFDITTLLQFTPPLFLCQKCYALLQTTPYNEEDDSIKCPVCGVEYIATEDFGSWEFGKYLEYKGLGIQFDDLIEHSRKLARIAFHGRRFLASPKDFPFYPPIRALFEAFLHAQQFVHFTTYGISHMFLGALKIVAQRVPVRGIISNIDSNMVKELTEYKHEAPGLNVQIFERGGQPKGWDTIPHQKIIVVDGLIAFKGSANLTVSGWRKAARGRDVIEVETDIKEVIDIHNRFFSPIWAEFSDVQEITMEEFPF